MQIITDIIITVIIVFGPRLMVLLCNKVKLLGMLGPIFLCYALGIILGIVFNGLSLDNSVASVFTDYTIPVAIPLILFSANFASLKKIAKPAVISFALMCVSVMIVSALGFCVFRGEFEYASALSGMMVGLYTGGTPNLVAIGSSLNVPGEIIAMGIAADTVAGGIYFLMLLSIMPKIVRKILPAFKMDHNEDAGLERRLSEEYVPEKSKFSIMNWIKRIPALLVAIACFGISALFALLITGSLDNDWVIVVVMLTVTSLGIAFSYVKKIRTAPGTYSTGQYLIYMFSVAMGLTLDFSSLNLNMISMFLFFCFVQFLSVIVHMVFAKLFKIDADTALITSTAGIYGPAFVGPVAGALNNKQVILPGLVCGILGYAVGNYLGIAQALILDMF